MLVITAPDAPKNAVNIALEMKTPVTIQMGLAA